ncbi:MAG: aldo/keto reductase [Verrucomicrobiota bacterium]
MKIALGTVQFGMRYGIANTGGQTSPDEVGEILAYARSQGVDTLDTAIGYGESEAVLGGHALNGWKVISKIGSVPTDCKDTAAWVKERILGSLSRLRIPALYALLLHSPRQLLEAKGDEIYSALNSAKEEGIIGKFGVSIYNPRELDMLVDRYPFGIVQAPFNILDHRLVDSGWMGRLQAAGVEIHVRSLFLQGLLLMSESERPKTFLRWKNLWTAWSAWLEQTHQSALEACLRFVLAHPEINRAVVGVDSLKQIQEICAATSGEAPSVPSSIRSDDEELLNPSCWSNL